MSWLPLHNCMSKQQLTPQRIFTFSFCWLFVGLFWVSIGLGPPSSTTSLRSLNLLILLFQTISNIFPFLYTVEPVTGSILVTKRNQEQTTLSSTTPVLHYNSRIIFHVSDNASTCTCWHSKLDSVYQHGYHIYHIPWDLELCPNRCLNDCHIHMEEYVNK